MTAMLRAEGVNVNRKRVQRLMRLMGIAALVPKPRTSKPAPGHRIYPEDSPGPRRAYRG
jgi:putative transposase